MGGRVSRLLLWSWAGLEISGLFCPATIHFKGDNAWPVEYTGWGSKRQSLHMPLEAMDWVAMRLSEAASVDKCHLASKR